MPHNEFLRQHVVDANRQKSPKKQLKPTARCSTMPKPASVAAEADEADTVSVAGIGEESMRAFTGGPEAMDIDESFPAPNHQATPSSNDTPVPPPAETKSLNMKNLKSVHPLAATNCTGLNDLNDLNTLLPFDSRPAKNPNLRATVRPCDLPLPKPPKAPVSPVHTPEQPSHGKRPEPILTQAAWHRYMADMGAYMHDWNAFNRIMIGHFNECQRAVESGLAPRWMSAVGDSTRLNIGFNFDAPLGQQQGADSGSTEEEIDNERLAADSGKGGFRAYLRAIEEDFVWRQHWDVAWERHLECILALGRIRDWIRRGGKIRSGHAAAGSSGI
jgi:hypothetical protein